MKIVAFYSNLITAGVTQRKLVVKLRNIFCCHWRFLELWEKHSVSDQQTVKYWKYFPHKSPPHYIYNSFNKTFNIGCINLDWGNSDIWSKECWRIIYAVRRKLNPGSSTYAPTVLTILLSWHQKKGRIAVSYCFAQQSYLSPSGIRRWIIE